jgi:hypothetical protein
MGRSKRVVAVDLPGGPWGYADSEASLKAVISDLQKRGFDAHLFLGNSRNPAIQKKVEELGPYDFVFIDGDHRYEMVKKDWEFYGRMGKRVAFHDIQPPQTKENAELGVHRLWDELKGRDDAQSFIAPGSPMGVGCIG